MYQYGSTDELYTDTDLMVSDKKASLKGSTSKVEV